MKTKKKMASGTSNMKGFYKQKKTGGVPKKPSSKTLTEPKSSPSHAAALGSDVTQPPALVTNRGALDLPDERDWEKGEMVLKQFDMDMKYGPCVGMTRMDRWERARRLGLDPPCQVQALLREPKVRQDSLWDGRV